MSRASDRPPLLGADDPAPVMISEGAGDSPFVFCCDHAGALVPEALGSLGVSSDLLDDHIAVDIGIFAVTCWVSMLLRASMVAQPYSRLVIDSNRRPGVESSIPEVSDGYPVPGNRSLSQADRDARRDEILLPYQKALGEVLAEHSARRDKAPILIAMHSFARRMQGDVRRDVDIGIIYEGANPFAEALFVALSTSGYVVRHNAPYRVGLTEDYTIPVHGHAPGRPYVEIEICQDLISGCAGQRQLAQIFRKALPAAFAATLTWEASHDPL